MTEWQPIETAPKGKKLLAAFQNEQGHWRTITARYYLPRTLDCDEAAYDQGDEDGFAPEGWYEESETHDNILPISRLTHWQPLPEPPPTV